MHKITSPRQGRPSKSESLVSGSKQNPAPRVVNRWNVRNRTQALKTDLAARNAPGNNPLQQHAALGDAFPVVELGQVGKISAFGKNDPHQRARIAADDLGMGGREELRQQSGGRPGIGVDHGVHLVEDRRDARARGGEEERLLVGKVAIDQPFEQRRTARDEAQREVERLRATLSRFGTGDIEAQSDVVVAARALDAAKADLARAEGDLDKSYVRAPIAGTVLTINIRPSERPSS